MKILFTALISFFVLMSSAFAFKVGEEATAGFGCLDLNIAKALVDADAKDGSGEKVAQPAINAGACAFINGGVTGILTEEVYKVSNSQYTYHVYRLDVGNGAPPLYVFARDTVSES